MRWPLLVIALLFLLAISCGPAKDDSRVSEVAAATPCSPERCMPPAEVQASVGFRPLEPSFLPDGWQLYSRTAESMELPLPAREMEARIRGVPVSEVRRMSQPTLVLDYRFQNSNFVPAIILREDLAEQPVTSLTPETPDCAEVISIRDIRALYGLGSGSLRPGPTPGTWQGCAEIGNDRNAHVVMLARGRIVVQIRAFPEANLTKEDVLKIAASLRPAP